MSPVTATPVRRLAVLTGPAELGSNMIWSRRTHGRAAREARAAAEAALAQLSVPEPAPRPRLVALVAPAEVPALICAAA